MGTQVVISTRRLRLRTWRHGDWKTFDAALNTDAVMQWLGGCVGPRLIRREVAWNMRHYARYGFCFFPAERKRDRVFVGFCGLIRVGEVASPIRGELEIGWRIAQPMWRRGYALEAASAVLDWAVTKLPDQTVYARINVHNEASTALALKLGMHRLKGADHTHPADGMRLAIYAINPAERAR